ncbi:T-box transcription factor TBX22 isoform X1 [Paramormyrops kingsleyae]|uniref:T-box transcription factor TBX22 isoform X1 n=1 Tax=Paramormyrops kingsleyae TaxID=1676925 RepID=UPI003B971C7E
MQGLSSRAHAFSVEALVGRASCKRMKLENRKEENAQNVPRNAEQQDMPACTVISEEEEPDNETERRRKGDLAQREPAEDECDQEKEVAVELQGTDLWNRFHEIGTEMIITKAGRRMFPSVRVKVKSLDPFKQYYIALDITPVDSKRYRYVYHSSQWMVAGNTDHSCIAPRLYVHPDSPCSGETWMRQVISFDRVKLTNNELDDKGHIILQSMHKYQPRIHVIEHDPRVDLSQIQSLPAEGVHSFSFPETQFTTVTAYQNQQITKLKIDRNPFAKGFRDPGRNRGVLDGLLDSYPWRNPLGFDLKGFSMEPHGGNSGYLSSCGTQSTLKGLLSPACTPPSFPFSIPCSDTALPGLTLPLCYKASPSAGLLAARPYGLPGPEKLRDLSECRPVADFQLLSALHRKKESSCRAQCLRRLPAGPSCQPTLHSLQGTGVSVIHQPYLHHETLQQQLPPPYSLYGYSLPTGTHFPGAARHLKLSDGLTLMPADNLLPRALCHPTINHCL